MVKILIITLAVLTSASAFAETYLVPAVAFLVPGHDGNRWSSELYLTNSSSEQITVTLGPLLLGRRRPPEPCLTFVPVTRKVPAHTTLLWSAAELGPDMGCATLALGGLMLDATAPIDIRSRLVNHGANPPRPFLPLHGPGQVFDAVPTADLPRDGAHQLPGLLWHRNACGPEEFATNLGFANPGEEPVDLTVNLPPSLAEQGIRIAGEPVELPHKIRVPAHRWKQVKVQPEPSMLTVCMDPELFVVWIDTSGPVAIYASVIDRPAQDPRTVTPVERK
jgi:hypothetical protein